MNTLLNFIFGIAIIYNLARINFTSTKMNQELSAYYDSMNPLTSPKAQLSPLYPLTGTQAKNNDLDSSIYPLTKHELVNGSDESKPVTKALLHNGHSTPQLTAQKPSKLPAPEHETIANTEGGK
ncbi:hypothetical protein TUM3794_29660 [Shewanella colwelliana]|uniref:Uncharacterized protein n=1 Tax=Shewanella colwelliana TaxID=23 RepID=A0ABQ4P8Y7_SHECO|nr:hypothetical protein [Shewanella colwelliana]GIU43601.1 hypothetical protein TUM3794_29660 [Shewanella colwelliana]